MRKSILMSLFVVLMVTAWAIAAEQKKSPAKVPTEPKSESVQAAQEKAVRQTAEAFVSAFNKGDAKAVAALWTAQCEYVDENGRIYRGRDTIEKEYAAFFAKNPGVQMEVSISSIRIVSDNVALEDGSTLVKSSRGKFLSRGYYTAVHAKEGNSWLMADVREYSGPSPAVGVKLGDLDWIIGDWTAAKGSKTVEFSFKWTAEKKFVELAYAVKEKAGVARSGIQIIGRDPSSGELASWSFDSGGGYGRGQLRLQQNGWIAESYGMMSDGRETTSTDIVSKTDADGFTWQSVNRSLGGQRLPDSKTVTLKRKTQ